MLLHGLVASAALALASAFSGDGTFYGAGGAGHSGACMLQPGFNGVGITVAMNAAQFEDGGACGKCVRITAPNTGATPNDGRGMTPIVGPIYATVDNECPECAFGSVDLGLGGDGRWPISWEFVDCNEARSAGSVLPAKMGMDRVGSRRALRGGEQQQQDEAVVLQPGYLVTVQGIRLIADVKAEQQQQDRSNNNGH